MKIYTNKRYTTIAVYAALVIAANVVLVAAILNIKPIMSAVGALVSVMSPIIWGLVIAFLMNPVMVRLDKLMDRFIFKSKQHNKLKRGISVGVSSVVFAGAVFGLLWVVIPELITSVNNIIGNFSSIVDSVQKWITRIFKNNPKVQSFAMDKVNDLTNNLGTILDRIQPMITNVLSGAWTFVKIVKDFGLGFIVSIYILLSKETLLAQTKKIILANFKKPSCEKLMGLAGQTNSIFSGFLGGKIIDSIIIGIICFVGLTIMGMDYSLMISVIIGVTNIIPFFGPFIGAIPSGLFILIVQPNKFIPLIIFIFILQQFDGNVLGPKILGDSTGLPGFWVMVSLFIGGGLFGFVGMVLSVPAFALIYSLIRENVERKLKNKRMPVSTEYYKDNIEHLYVRPKRQIPLTIDELDKVIIPPADEVNEANLDE